MKYTLKKDYHHVPGHGLVTREDFTEEHLNAMIDFVKKAGGDPAKTLAVHLIEVGERDQIVLPLNPSIELPGLLNDKINKIDKRSKEYKESKKALENTEVGNYKEQEEKVA